MRSIVTLRSGVTEINERDANVEGIVGRTWACVTREVGEDRQHDGGQDKGKDEGEHALLTPVVVPLNAST